MKTAESLRSEGIDRFQYLIEDGVLSEDALNAAGAGAQHRNVDIERILRHEYGIARRTLLKSLSRHCGCPWVEYDERVPVPAELLAGLDAEKLCQCQWFPTARRGETVIIAATDPQDPDVIAEVRNSIPAESYEFRVTLGEDIQAFIEDFLNSDPEHLIGNERTALAFWRNTMAQWRTKLACYRTDFAKARTHLSLLRGGLALIAIGRTLIYTHKGSPLVHLFWVLIGLGFLWVAAGLYDYYKIKMSFFSPPKHQSLVEVTAATLYFLEDYQYEEVRGATDAPKKTMLARLADLLPKNCVFIEPSLDNKVRSYLAHERNALSGQRTVAACYRTIYSRARTGLSFIRTGVSFAGIGLGLVQYFGLSWLTLFDFFLILAGAVMVVDGLIWYLPIRKEQSEFPAPPVPF
jgi:uncharacterized membrane protein YidH (DUF202 family)